MPTISKTGKAVLALITLAGLAACQQLAGDAAKPAGNVVVEFQAMDKFTDFTDEPWSNALRAEDAAALFREATIKEARRHLTEGQTLKVTFTDVDLAGDDLPSANMGVHAVRIVKTLYPPRIKLTFTLTDATGAVLKQGERSLVDYNFMERADITSDGALRYDLRLLREWVRSELAPRHS